MLNNEKCPRCDCRMIGGICQNYGCESDITGDRTLKSATESKCELRPGIGLCDDCGLAKWPQVYQGYGIMVCLDCIEREERARRARVFLPAIHKKKRSAGRKNKKI